MGVKHNKLLQTATLLFVSVAAHHFYTKMLSAVCVGEQGVIRNEVGH